MRQIMCAVIVIGAWFQVALYPAQAENSVKIASVFAHTGAAAASNNTAVMGVRYAVEELNRRGGVLGRQVELVEYDNYSKAIQSKKAAQKAVKAGVNVVVGANWSSHALAMAPVLQNARIPMISPYATHPDVTAVGDYIFRVCFIDSFQGKVMADFAREDLKANTAAILVNASRRYSEGLAEFFQKRFTQKGGTIVFTADYLEDTTLFASHLQAVITHDPDVIFIPGNNVDSGRILRQARDLGITAPFMGGDGWGYAMVKHAGSAAQGTHFSSHWHMDSELPASRRFVAAYKKAFNSDPDSGTAMAYDAVSIFAAAAARAGTLEPETLRQEIAATRNFTGVTGNITFNENRNPIKPAVIMKFHNNKKVYVKTILP